jgi:UDP-3-O-[3-hydroxymyristoyl] glucosamine N-acyltransferase
MKLGEIAHALPAEVIGNASLEIRRLVHPLDATDSSDLAIALSRDALSASANGRAGAVLIPADAPRPAGRTLLVYGGDERQALATLTRMFDAGPAHWGGVHPTAVIAPDAVIGAGASVGPHTVVGSRTTVGARTTLIANVTVGADVVIGADCTLHPGVVVCDRVRLGARVIIHPTAVIGSDGFSFIPAQGDAGIGTDANLPRRIHSLGTVVIEDDVEIGAGTTIDRATVRQTRVGAGTKIDNQVQVAHNVTIGASCVICGKVGIAGSAVIGDRVVIGAAAGISDHVRVGAGATVGALSGVATDVPAGVVVSGIPADRHERTLQRYAGIMRLKRLREKVAELESRLAALEHPGRG